MTTPYFTAAELRALDTALTNTDKHPDAELEQVRDLVEQSIEDACHVAFVTRRRMVTVSGDGGRILVSPVTLPRAVTAAASLDESLDIAAVRVVDGVALYRPAGWPRGHANLTLTIEHGHDVPPLRVKSAALILAHTWLLKGPVSDRATQVPATADGVGALNLATPGLLGSRFGVPEVDQVVREYREVTVA